MRRHRQVRQVAPSHTDDWLITYADTITLLLCLFVVLLASQSRKMELITEHAVLLTPVEKQEASISAPDWRPHFQPTTPRIRVPEEDTQAVAEERTSTRSEEDQFLLSNSLGEARARDIANLPEASTTSNVFQPVFAQPAPADAVVQQTTSVPRIPPISVLESVKPGGDAQVAPNGDRITTIVFDSMALFGRASATLSSSGKVVLQEVVRNLKSAEFRDYMVTIEGHTDDSPINTAQFPSNWELSTARAAAVVRFCLEEGVSAQRLRAAGYADTRPLQPNRDRDGNAMPENQAKNRRVVIELEKVERR